MQDSSLTLIELSNRCNLRCTYCANRTASRPIGRMPLFDFDNVLEQIFDYHGSRSRHFRICLHGFGEPTINPFLGHYLRSLDWEGYRNVDFSTNGQELGKALPTICAAKCLSWIRVSLQSCRKATMEAMNVGADFERVVANTKALIAAKPKCRVVVQHAKCPPTDPESEDEFRELIGGGDWHYARKLIHTQCSQAPSGPATEPVSCAGGYGSRLIIHWDGDMVGCCSDNTKQQVYGNAFRDGIYSEKTRAARKRLMDEFSQGQLTNLPLCQTCLQGNS